jgi:hypothetical protein
MYDVCQIKAIGDIRKIKIITFIKPDTFKIVELQPCQPVKSQRKGMGVKF